MNREPEAPRHRAPARPASPDSAIPPVQGSPFTVLAIEVTTTCESQAVAESMAQLVVAERLAACAQVIGPVTSVYWWEGRVERAVEWYCHMKTTAARWPELETRIKSSHPYRVPEIIALPIIGGSADYLTWIEAQVTSKG